MEPHVFWPAIFDEVLVLILVLSHVESLPVTRGEKEDHRLTRQSLTFMTVWK